MHTDPDSLTDEEWAMRVNELKWIREEEAIYHDDYTEKYVQNTPHPIYGFRLNGMFYPVTIGYNKRHRR